MDNLKSHIIVGVWRNTIGPVRRDLLSGKPPGTVRVLLGAEEGRNGREIRGVAVSATGHQFVQERGRSVQQQCKGTKEEVGVLDLRLVPALIAVDGKVLAGEGGGAGVVHHAEESAVDYGSCQRESG